MLSLRKRQLELFKLLQSVLYAAFLWNDLVKGIFWEVFAARRQGRAEAQLSLVLRMQAGGLQFIPTKPVHADFPGAVLSTLAACRAP